MEEFKTKLAEIMELDDLQDNDVLRDFPEWDSLTVLSVISMVYSKYGKSLTADGMKKAVTVRALYDLVEQ